MLHQGRGNVMLAHALGGIVHGIGAQTRAIHLISLLLISLSTRQGLRPTPQECDAGRNPPMSGRADLPRFWKSRAH